MFKPYLIEGTAICRSVHDPALALPMPEDPEEARKEAARIGREHHESCGTSELPCADGEYISEFEVKVLSPLAKRPSANTDDAEAYCLEWYKLCIVAIDGNTDRKMLLEQIPRVVMVEIGGYASRLNNRTAPLPFSSSQRPKRSAAQAGSTDSAQSKRRNGGTRKRT